jgi:4-hydroxy-2-oxoheptanedioate aldolase
MNVRTSRIKAKWKRGKAALATCLHLTDASLFELASQMGFDGIWMDLEHHGYSVETAAQLMRATRAGVADVVARPGKGEFARMARMLEAGAQAIMYPRCDNAEEAAEVVKWAKFAPLGKRGFDGSGADAAYCTQPLESYIRHANEQTLLIIQLEDPSAIEKAESIARVEGVDAIMFGPADFSLLCGIAGQFDHPRIASATRRIAEAAKAAKKEWACPAGSPDHARQLLDMGARLLFHMADIVMVKNGLEAIQREFGPLGFSFKSTDDDDQTDRLSAPPREGY